MKGDKLARRTLLKSTLVAGGAAVAMAAPTKGKKKVLKVFVRYNKNKTKQLRLLQRTPRPKKIRVVLQLIKEPLRLLQVLVAVAVGPVVAAVVGLGPVVQVLATL